MRESASGFLDAARMTAHLLFGLPQFLWHSPDRVHYRALLQKRIGARAENFLSLLEHSVYPFPRSPYHRLLKAAGCELGDVKQLVLAHGLEGALERIRQAGIFVTLDEFKARRPAHRGSQSWQFAEADFDNPRLRRHFEVKSGGTRSGGTRTMIDLKFIAAMAMDTSVLFDVHGLWHHHQAIWLPLGGTALIALMIYARLGKPPVRWFSQVDGRSSQLSFKYRAGTEFLLRYGGFFARRLPQPEFLPIYDAAKVAQWIAEMTGKAQPVCLTTFASAAVRVCCEAQRNGLDIRGAVFITIGEPLSAARKEIIRAAGAKAVCRYAITEVGILGYACGDPREPDDVHLLKSNLALIQAKRAVLQDTAVVDATYVSSLLPAAPKILLNAETGDYAALQDRQCSCDFGSLGYSTHLANIHSFEKLTGEGVTFAGTDLARILEEVLPARFGGSGVDYQIVEEEEAGGLPRLFLLVDPGVGEIKESDVVACFLMELAKQSEAQKIMAEMWAQSDAVRVRRARPVGTRAGKVFPFHLAPGAKTKLAEQGEVEVP